jgi:hypothetical protein
VGNSDSGGTERDSTRVLYLRQNTYYVHGIENAYRVILDEEERLNLREVDAIVAYVGTIYHVLSDASTGMSLMSEAMDQLSSYANLLNEMGVLNKTLWASATATSCVQMMNNTGERSLGLVDDLGWTVMRAHNVATVDHWSPSLQGLGYYEDCNHHAGILGRLNVDITLNALCNGFFDRPAPVFSVRSAV